MPEPSSQTARSAKSPTCRHRLALALIAPPQYCNPRFEAWTRSSMPFHRVSGTSIGDSRS